MAWRHVRSSKYRSNMCRCKAKHSENFYCPNTGNVAGSCTQVYANVTDKYRTSAFRFNLVVFGSSLKFRRPL